MTEVVDAMVESFEASAVERLTDRLVSAIEAGITAGKSVPSLQRIL